MVRRILPWVKALRITTAILAVLMLLTSFEISGQDHGSVLWLLIPFTAFTVSGTMVLNDWYDRESDVKKGKRLAYENPYKVFTYAVYILVLAGILTGFISLYNIKYGALSALLIIMGILYNRVRHIPYLGALWVSASCAIAATYPLLSVYRLEVLLFVVLVFMVIFARENIKDTQETAFDKGNKPTIPVLLGRDKAVMISVIILVFTVPLILCLSTTWISAIGYVMMISAPHALVTNSISKYAKNVLDIGLLVCIAGFLL